MKRIWLALIIASTVHALAAPARQLSLDGAWEFTNGQTGWESINVPGNWDTLPAYSTYAGKGWYRRVFTVPAAWRGKRLRLRFDAVNYETQVYLNNVEIGSHVGGYTPFEFDVTDKISYGGDNTLAVCADNSMHQRGAWWHWGGISRNVTLFADNDARIVWQHITASPDITAGTAAVTVKYRIANTSAASKTIHLASRLGEDTVCERDINLLPASETGVTLSFTMRKVRLWDFDHPNLYSLVSTISEPASVLDTRTDRFGVRKVEVKPDGLYLNGEKVRLVGFNRVSDSYQTGNTEPDALVHKDIDLMKCCGADMARLMHFPQAPNLLDYLDEKGMLIFEEIPVWGSGDPNVKPGNPLTEQWLREMIDRDYNHPCIIGWSPGNEIQNHYAYVSSMHDYIRQNLDSSRLLTYVSNTAAGKNSGPSNDPATISNPILLNSYNSFDGPAQVVHQRWPDKPLFFSEWGFGQIGANLNATIPHFEQGLAKTVEGHPWLIGLSIWTFNDYRNGFKTGPASGNREWGVVDINRRPKAAYYQVRKAFSPVHALTVSGGQVRIDPRTPDEVPSYPLRDYTLKWKTDTQTGSIPVPILKPGDPPWTAPLPAVPGIKASLYTPTGYDVTDTEESK